MDNPKEFDLIALVEEERMRQEEQQFHDDMIAHETQHDRERIE